VNVNLGGGGPSSFTALSMAAGAASLFMIGFAQFPGGYFEEPWNPQWPCCNNGGPGNGSGSGVFITMPLPAGTGSSITPTVLGSASPYCDELKHCLVANPTDVYYMRHGDVAAGYTAAIDDYSKITDTITTLDTISTMLSQSATPVGLGTTPTHVAWAVAMNGQQFQQEIPPGCWIFVHTVGEPGGGHQVFQSGNFSCLDLAMDDSFIYFTIVRSVHQDDNNCGNCSEPIHGVGIGRVSFDGSTYESIALNIQGQSYAGPRRVLLDGLTGSALYLADPLVVAKVPRDALAGHQDIPQ
jgi:hypothetical protein